MHGRPTLSLHAYFLHKFPFYIQVTRSIGDDDLKPAVTAEPEITETLLTTEDEYLVSIKTV